MLQEILDLNCHERRPRTGCTTGRGRSRLRFGSARDWTMTNRALLWSLVSRRVLESRYISTKSAKGVPFLLLVILMLLRLHYAHDRLRRTTMKIKAPNPHKHNMPKQPEGYRLPRGSWLVLSSWLSLSSMSRGVFLRPCVIIFPWHRRSVSPSPRLELAEAARCPAREWFST
jgi:hypothetical protein